MKPETKTAAQITSEAILSMALHPTYKPVPDIPLPLQYGVIVKPLPKSNIYTIPIITETGEETSLFAATGENTQPTCEGVIYSVGPQCSAYVRVGLRCQYRSDVDTSFRHKGVEYMKMDEFSILFIMPDPTTIVDNGVKSDKAMGRQKRMDRQKKITAHESKEHANFEDKNSHKTKGKIKPVSNKIK